MTKMKVSYIVIGFLLIVIAYAISPISIPWISWVGDIIPIPQYTPISFMPLAYILGCIGIIAIIFGLTKNGAIRMFFSFLAIMVCLGLLTGFISFEKIEEWLKHIKLG
jgi:hypothetical protein